MREREKEVREKMGLRESQVKSFNHPSQGNST